MKYTMTFEELTGKFKDEVEIIYKDANLVCMLPKSQMASNIYGTKTKWCQISKGGFEGWTMPKNYSPGKEKTMEGENLLFRFLMKGGRKIRMTYEPSKLYHWATETGFHLLHGVGNPFDANIKGDKIRDNEKDLLYLISKIPNECRNEVIKFIGSNIGYNYTYRDDEYASRRVISNENDVKKISIKYENIISDMEKNKCYLRFGYSRGGYFYLSYWMGKEYVITKTGGGIQEFEFERSDQLEIKLKEVFKEYNEFNKQK